MRERLVVASLWLAGCAGGGGGGLPGATDLPDSAPAPAVDAFALTPTPGRTSPPEQQIDEADAGGPEARMCSAEPRAWLGCSAGCGVCGDLVGAYDLYLPHHPACAPAASSCAGATRACSAQCPPPTMDDASCRPVASGWPGCAGSGCAVDGRLLDGFPGYERAHPGCTILPGPTGPHVGCATLCPPPSPADRTIQDGVAGGWPGCRGYGIWVCVELLDGYPRYFQNHPACVPNGFCDGEHFLCSAACPAPTAADR